MKLEEKVSVYLNSARTGGHDEIYAIVVPRWPDTPTDMALRFAGQLPAGGVLKFKQGTSVWRYKVGRYAGLPSVTRIKATKHRRTR